MIEASLFTLISTASTVGPLVQKSDGSGYRIYPERIPQDATFPAIAYNIIDSPSYHSQSGKSNLKYPRIQISCWSDDYDNALIFGKLVDDLLDGFKGTVGSSRIDGILQQNDITMYDNTSRNWRRMFDYLVLYAEL